MCSFGEFELKVYLFSEVELQKYSFDEFELEITELCFAKRCVCQNCVVLLRRCESEFDL